LSHEVLDLVAGQDYPVTSTVKYETVGVSVADVSLLVHPAGQRLIPLLCHLHDQFVILRVLGGVEEAVVPEGIAVLLAMGL
jgi:hypothetical protein